MFFSRRKRLQELANREAAGESLWTDVFDGTSRAKLVLLMQSLTADDYPRGGRLILARTHVLHDVGQFFLSDGHADPVTDLIGAVLNGDSDIVATVIEAVYLTLVRDTNGYVSKDHASFGNRVNEVLREHRISFELVEGQMVEFQSKQLHESVVAPTLRLLSGRQGWEAVEQTYQKALEEIGDDPADAITDAGTALQEALTLLGCEGNQLGKLAASARRKGFLNGHDTKVVDWVAADRSETGDTHNARPASHDDAWLTVHVVGALILRLAGAVPRSRQS